jgi:hypothetical protein
VRTYADEYEATQRRRADIADIIAGLSVAALLLICILAIVVGVYVSIRADNEGIPILAAIGCAVVINALLGPKGG